uniref:Bloodthirsty-related gene family, member 2 n=1 Tax=Hippocampus comes TaxID=109280 RepID=A0A3Q2YRQ6_HIPCM
MVLNARKQVLKSASSLLPEKSLLCSLCKDIFSSPVTTPCGHSFCLSCLCDYWMRHQSRYCPCCRRLFANRPDLSVNHILAEISDNYKKTRPQKIPDEETQMIQERLQKVDRLKTSLELQKVRLKLNPQSVLLFSALVHAMEKSHKAVVAAIEERQKEEQKKVQNLVQELEQEIRELTKESAVSDSLVPEKTSDQQDELKEDSTVKLKRIQRYIGESLSTAHPTLSVSDDRKQVRQSDKRHEVPDHPKRFDRVANVLAKESFSCGRSYWEVEVGDKTEWSLGAVRESINRKGRFTVCPANGFWTLSLKMGGQYVANTSPASAVALEQRPRKVAVYVDYAEGRVSFYCAETGIHIHTFTDTFTDSLHPFFCPGRLHGGKNAEPLIISSSFCSI